MAGEESALLRLWREGEFEPEDISVNLIVQLWPAQAVSGASMASYSACVPFAVAEVECADQPIVFASDVKAGAITIEQ